MTTKTELLKTIRKHCLICCGGSCLDVKNCTSGPDASPYSTCLLWPFRLGVDPNPSESKVEAGKKKIKSLHPDKIEGEACVASLREFNQASISSGHVT